MKDESFLKCSTVLFNVLILLDLALNAYKVHNKPAEVWKREFILQIINRVIFFLISVVAFVNIFRRKWKFVEFYGFYVLVVFVKFITSILTNLVFLILGKFAVDWTQHGAPLSDKVLIAEGIAYSLFLVVYFVLCLISGYMIVCANSLRVKEFKRISDSRPESADVTRDNSQNNESNDLIVKS